MQLGNNTILIVEDDALTQVTLKQSLQKHDFKTDAVQTAREALYKLKNNRYRAVIVDIQLPDMTGIALSQILRKRGDRTPLIAHSGFDDRYTRETAYQAGMQAFFSKPACLESLIDWIDQHTSSNISQYKGNGNRFRMRSRA